MRILQPPSIALACFILVYTVVFSPTFNLLAQAEDSILIYEVGRFPCDGFRGTIDILLSELSANPGWDGVVVNIGREDDEVFAVIREEMIRNHVSFRTFDATRIRYSRSVGDEFKTQYRRIPSTQINLSPPSRNYVLTSVVNPVTIEDYDFDDLCPPIDYGDVFATILEQNPRSKATVVIRGATRRDARNKFKEVSNNLLVTRKIAPDRVKFFLTEKPDFHYGTDPVVEYRYVP